MRNQRERIFGAMVASTATKGYPATTVADLIWLAGVSRATFYEHFKDKGDCFRATVEALLEAGLALIRSRLDGPGNPKERGERAISSFLKLMANQPAAAKVSLVEAYSAGPAGLKPINNAFEEACELAHEAMRMLPNRDRTPEELSRAVIGGLHRVIYIHLYRGEEQELLERCGALWRWASGYEPPEGLPKPRKRRRFESEVPPYSGRDQHERILRGFARAAVARGFTKVTIPQIAAETGISNATFYQHFESKDDALLAALDLSGAQLIAATLPAARRLPDWAQAMHRAIENMCRFLLSEPDLAKLRAVEVYAAGPEALAHRDRAWETVIEELIPADVREGPEPNRLMLDASTGAIDALLYEKVRRNQLEKLRELHPLLSYIVLAPFIGAEEATRVASGEAREAAEAPGGGSAGVSG
ncbi:MAG TPA: TetR/AcrR family transcriptional regulator [Solirubrobacterales bacterium]|nr:TetR/AcrR family transcriptional regulator [Solirubrobacterales bacterium]